MNILFSSAGRRVELLQCFRRSARELGINLKVWATDLKPEMSAACRVADLSFAVPRCTMPEFIPAMLQICREHSISLLIPTIDTELLTLAEHRDEFNAIGCRIVVSDPAMVALARNKGATAKFLSAALIPTPRTGSVDEVVANSEDWNWPLIFKPAGGSCSAGIHIVSGPTVVPWLQISNENYIVQELWRGREYTVNMFFDQAGSLKAAVPHWRYETRGGEVSKGITERVPILMEVAERVGEALRGKAFGPLCFQAIINDAAQAAVFEINARFGGGYPLTDEAGGKFCKWLLEESLGLSCSAHNKWKDGTKMLRYDAAVFSTPD